MCFFFSPLECSGVLVNRCFPLGTTRPPLFAPLSFFLSLFNASAANVNVYPVQGTAWHQGSAHLTVRWGASLELRKTLFELLSFLHDQAAAAVPAKHPEVCDHTTHNHDQCCFPSLTRSRLHNSHKSQ